jgi:hypothetical protein
MAKIIKIDESAVIKRPYKITDKINEKGQIPSIKIIEALRG